MQRKMYAIRQADGNYLAQDSDGDCLGVELARAYLWTEKEWMLRDINSDLRPGEKRVTVMITENREVVND